MEYYQHGDYISESNHEKAVVRQVSTSKIIKRFTGELAWQQAEILVDDLGKDNDMWNPTSNVTYRWEAS